MRTSSFLFFSALALACLGACSSNDTPAPGASTGATTATTGTGGSTSSTTSAAGTGGGVPACGPTCTNDCDPLKATDLTAMTDITIQFGGATGFKYDPACIKVKAGTKITWSGDFSLHPLEPGTIVGDVATPDMTSPIMSTTTGMSATFTLDKAGTFGFYCGVHMFRGAAFVE